MTRRPEAGPPRPLRLVCALTLLLGAVAGEALAAAVKAITAPAGGVIAPGAPLVAPGAAAGAPAPGVNSPALGLPGFALPSVSATFLDAGRAEATRTEALSLFSPEAMRERNVNGPAAETPSPRASREKLKFASRLARPRPGANGAESKSSWDAFWHALSVRPQGASVLASPPGGARRNPAPLARSLGSAKRSPASSPAIPQPSAAETPGLAGILAAVGPAVLTALSWPYVQAAGALIGTWLAARLVKAGLRKFFESKELDKNVLMAVALLTDLLLWAGGGTAALRLAGMDWTTLFASLGIGGLAVTMSVKEFVGNFMRGVFLLLQQPFKVGETVKIGKEEYRVIDMTFRYMVLSQTEEDFTLMTYTELAGKPVTLFRESDARPSSARLNPAESGPGKRAAWKRTAALALFAASALTGGFWLHSALAASAPYLYAAGALAGALAFERLMSRALAWLARRKNWDPNTSAVLRMAFSAAVYLGATTAALRLGGLGWTSLLTGAGILGVVGGIAASDLIANIIQAVWILFTQPFKPGDRIEVSGQAGTVAYMDLRYVVLRDDSSAQTRSILLPYSMIQGSPIKVHKAYLKNSPDDDR